MSRTVVEAVKSEFALMWLTLRVSEPSGYLDPSKITRDRESGGQMTVAK